MFTTFRNLFTGLMASHVQLHATETCEHCGSQLARDSGETGLSAVWFCPNPDCPPQLLKRVALWASPDAMDIAGCDAAIIEQLVRTGLVRDAAEFYRLKVSEIAALDGMDSAAARALWEAINASRNQEAWRVLVGLGIPGISVSEARLFCVHFKSLEDLFAMSRERLMKLDGVTESMARNLTRWYGDSVNRRVVRRLAKIGVNFEIQR